MLVTLLELQGGENDDQNVVTTITIISYAWLGNDAMVGARAPMVECKELYGTSASLSYLYTSPLCLYTPTTAGRLR